MRRSAYLSLAIAISLSACGGGGGSGGDGNGSPFGGSNDPSTGADGTAGGGDGTAGGGDGTAGGGDGTAGGGDGTAGNDGEDSIDLFGPDAGDDGTGSDGPVVVDIPDPIVPCGGSECTTKDSFVCCDQGTSNGWGTPQCKANSACNTRQGNPFTGFAPWDAPSECDGAEDCGLDQVCCFVQVGPPGTPAGRSCMALGECNSGMSLEGSGIGVYSCNEDGMMGGNQEGSDCPNNLSCVAEPNDSATTGDGRVGRSWVKICQ